MSTIFLFPGQGSQHVGMLEKVPKQYLTTCEQVTKIALVESETNYSDTVIIQLALFVVAAATVDELAKKQIIPNLVAGHSIGAFSAAYACGALSYEDGLYLVLKRAQAMKASYPTGYGMGVIGGLTRLEVERLFQEPIEYPVYLSNMNSSLQHTVSGDLRGIDIVLERAKKAQARLAKYLKVPVPSHCALMDKVVTTLTPLFEGITIQQPFCPYLQNVTGRATNDPEQIRQDLLQNIAHPVQWDQMMRVTKELGATMTIESPPGHTLTRLYQEAFGDALHYIAVADHGIADSIFLYEKWRGK